jgi:hypothetical protein
MVTRETALGFELANQVDVVVSTNSFRLVRGRAIALAVLDELAYWRDENSASPDTETYVAIKPSLASLPSSMVIGISSPYRRSGLLFEKYKAHFGKNDDDVLVIQAATRTLNPTIAQEIIDKAMQEDPVAARSEWGADWRDGIESFISREAVEACIVPGRFELPPLPFETVTAHIDPSGGSSDSMTVAVSMRQGDHAVLVAIREAKPPFSPEAVVADFAAFLKSYRIKTATSDRYGAEWIRERFHVHGIELVPSEKTTSDLYREFLPLVNSQKVELLDHPKAIAQICALERRTGRGGRDSIDHPPGGHDDLATVIAGSLVMATSASRIPRLVFG